MSTNFKNEESKKDKFMCIKSLLDRDKELFYMLNNKAVLDDTTLYNKFYKESKEINVKIGELLTILKSDYTLERVFLLYKHYRFSNSNQLNSDIRNQVKCLVNKLVLIDDKEYLSLMFDIRG